MRSIFISWFGVRSLQLIICAVLLCSIEPCRGEPTATEDFFDIIGKTPAEVATSIPDSIWDDDMAQLAMGFVGLPMSEAHRKEFIEALHVIVRVEPRAKPVTRHCLLNLLEEDGRFDEALAIINDGALKTDGDKVREVALLWRARKESEAVEAAVRITPSDRDLACWSLPAIVDLINNRPEAAMRFLEFWVTQSGLPANVRYALAMQHLKIAVRDDKADELIEQTTSLALKALRNSALGRNAEALENLKHADAEITLPDLELFLHAVGPEPQLLEQARKHLSKSDMTPEQRRSLLLHFDEQSLRFQLWAEMPGGHAETVAILGSYAEMFHSKNETDAAILACRRILAKQPEDARLQLVMAQLSKSEPGQGRAFLLEAARGFVVNPRSSRFSDPAARALERLVKNTEASDLYKLLIQAPGFTELPMPDQLRYLMIAQLDKPVVDILTSYKLDDPSNDSLGLAISRYLDARALGFTIPDELTKQIIARLPEIICGSPSKDPALIRGQTRSWFEFLAKQLTSKPVLVDTANRLMQVAERRSPEAKREVLAGFPPSIWVLPGLRFTQPPSGERDKIRKIPMPFNYLAIFTFPDLSVPSRRMGPESIRPRSLDRINFRKSDDSYPILLDSPWRLGIMGMDDENRKVLAKLRTLLDKFPDRTLIYDLVVATGGLECPIPSVRLSSEQRSATIITKNQMDPAIPAYYFCQRVAAGEPLEKAAVVIDGLDKFLIQDRYRLSNSLQGMMQNRRERRLDFSPIQLLTDNMGFMKFEVPQEPPAKPSAYDRLQFFKEAKKLDSPEAVTLAREVLFAFVESKSTFTMPQENIAIRALVVTNNFPVFLDDLKSRMNAAGASELEIQRALYRVHLYRVIHPIRDAIPFAKRVMELDPSDLQVTQDVLQAATVEKNPDLALKCLEALCRQSRRLFLRAVGNLKSPYQNEPEVSPLSLFTGDLARKMTDTLLSLPFQPVEDDNYSFMDQDTAGLLSLYNHVAIHDTEHLLPIIRWSQGMKESNRGTLLRFAYNLKQQQRDSEAITILAEAYLAPPSEESEDRYRFKRRNPTIFPNSNGLSLSDLSRNGWLIPLAEALATYPASPSTAGTRLLIEVAADPQIDTWNRVFPQFLEGLPIASRMGIERMVADWIRNVPNSKNLQNFLTKTDGTPPDAKLSPDVILEKILVAADAREPVDVAANWGKMMTALEAQTPDLTNYCLTRAALHLAAAADDAVWSEFLEKAGKSKGFAEKWVQNNGRPDLDSIPDKRVLEFIKLLMPELKPDERNLQSVNELSSRIFRSTPPDLELLRLFRPWVEISSQANNRRPWMSAKLAMLDLLSSEIAAVCPQISALPESDKSWTVHWSLAGFKGMRSGYPYAGNAAFLENRFDLEILAGPQAERLSIVSKVEKAAATGHLNLRLPDDTKYVCIAAKEHEGKIVRWSHPVLLEAPPFGEPIRILPVIQAAEGLVTTIVSCGPFLQDEATEIQSSKGTPIDLTQIPWTHGPLPMVSGWMLNLVRSGTIAFSFRTLDGVELGNQILQFADDDLDSLPFWQRFKTPKETTMPRETEKIVLVYKPSYQNRLSTVRLSNIRVTQQPVSPLPEGFHSIGRVPASVDQIAMDSRSNRFAVFSAKLGFGLFDLTTQRFSGWTPLQLENPEQSNEVVWAALAGDRLLWADRTGKVRLFLISKKKAFDVCQINRIGNQTETYGDIALSSDGNFLATHGVMAGTRILKVSDEGLVGERLIETPQVQRLAFARDNSTLEIRDGVNDSSLSLANWDKAELKVSRARVGQPNEEAEIRRWYLEGETMRDKVQNVEIRVSSDVDLPIRVFPNSRTIVLPSGVVALDGEKRPFFVSSYGNVIRIEAQEITGFGPPREK